MSILHQLLSGVDPDLISEIEHKSVFQFFPADTEILREGQYIKVIPLVVKGVLKVFSRFEDKELLLYYIQPGQSCVMSFIAGLKNQPSRVFAVTEEPTEAYLIPAHLMEDFSRNHSHMNRLFFDLFNLRYSDLLDTINHLLFDKLDQRLWDYLVQKSKITGSNSLKLSHRQIASELGTAREVISRLMKKFERAGAITQSSGLIKILKNEFR